MYASFKTLFHLLVYLVRSLSMPRGVPLFDHLFPVAFLLNLYPFSVLFPSLCIKKQRLLCSTGVTALHGAVWAGASTSGVECVCTCCLLIAAMHQACSQCESGILEEALMS